MYRDSCERNVIEGRNGNAKRRFGLDRLFSKLDETAKTEAALILLAMNACRWLARWLVLFSQILFPLLLGPAFSAAPRYRSQALVCRRKSRAARGCEPPAPCPSRPGQDR